VVDIILQCGLLDFSAISDTLEIAGDAALYTIELYFKNATWVFL